MKQPEIYDLIRLSPEEATQKHFDARNYVVAKRFAIFLIAATVIIMIAYLVDGRYFALISPITNMVILVGFFRVSKKPFFEKNFHQISILFILIEFLFLSFTNLISIDPYDDGNGIAEIGIIFFIVLLWFRYHLHEYLFLLGVVVGASVLNHLMMVLFEGLSPDMGGIIGLLITGSISLALMVVFTNRDRDKFLRIWRTVYNRYRDQVRMKEELEYAHHIQMSMLPQSEPTLNWLDIASLSLPATEVGGDYYDYFPVSDRQLAVVIGDVSGHGVASGLVLSGVRSCLYLLQEQPLQPVQIIEKLNFMAKQTTDKRMFITFMYVFFDDEKRLATFANAGHPSMIHYSAALGSIEQLHAKALPLGAMFKTNYGEKVISFDKNDVFFLYSDGVSEVMNRNGEEYGEERLLKTLFEFVQQESSSKNIRDRLLQDIWLFKGDREQTDDITMVVIKIDT